MTTRRRQVADGPRFPMAADSCRRRAELLPRKAARRRRELTPTAKWRHGSRPPAARRVGAADAEHDPPLIRSSRSIPVFDSASAAAGSLHHRCSPVRDAGQARARGRCIPARPRRAVASARDDNHKRAEQPIATENRRLTRIGYPNTSRLARLRCLSVRDRHLLPTRHRGQVADQPEQGHRRTAVRAGSSAQVTIRRTFRRTMAEGRRSACAHRYDAGRGGSRPG